MDTNPAVAIEERKEMVVEEITEIDMEMVPERYIDIISGEFAYDPVRLPLDQDPTQLLYDRKTLQTIWEIEQHAKNPFTRQWFDITGQWFEVQARHNSEALERGVRLIRDIAMEESQLAACILTPGLDIVKELVHMFQRFIDTENEGEDGVGNRKFPVLICGNNCEMVECVHYKIAGDGLEISEAISRKGGPSLDVEILRKFIGVRNSTHLSV